MTQHKNSRTNGTLTNDVDKIRLAIANATMHATGKAGDVLYDSYDSLKEKSLDVQDAVETYIAEKPLKSVGIALLTGVVVGFLLRKK